MQPNIRVSVRSAHGPQEYLHFYTPAIAQVASLAWLK